MSFPAWQPSSALHWLLGTSFVLHSLRQGGVVSYLHVYIIWMHHMSSLTQSPKKSGLTLVPWYQCLCGGVWTNDLSELMNKNGVPIVHHHPDHACYGVSAHAHMIFLLKSQGKMMRLFRCVEWWAAGLVKISSALHQYLFFSTPDNCERPSIMMISTSSWKRTLFGPSDPCGKWSWIREPKLLSKRLSITSAM